MKIERSSRVIQGAGMRAHKRIDKTPFWIPIDNLSKETRPYRFEMRILCYEVDEMVHVMV